MHKLLHWETRIQHFKRLHFEPVRSYVLYCMYYVMCHCAGFWNTYMCLPISMQYFVISHNKDLRSHDQNIHM